MNACLARTYSLESIVEAPFTQRARAKLACLTTPKVNLTALNTTFLFSKLGVSNLQLADRMRLLGSRLVAPSLLGVLSNQPSHYLQTQNGGKPSLYVLASAVNNSAASQNYGSFLEVGHTTFKLQTHFLTNFIFSQIAF